MKENKLLIGTPPAIAEKADKKAYEPPELIEWGAIRELTLGKEGSNLDGVTYVEDYSS